MIYNTILQRENVHIFFPPVQGFCFTLLCKFEVSRKINHNPPKPSPGILRNRVPVFVVQNIRNREEFGDTGTHLCACLSKPAFGRVL